MVGERYRLVNKYNETNLSKLNITTFQNYFPPIMDNVTWYFNHSQIF